MLGQTSSHNPERISNQQISAGNEMNRDMSNPENRLPQPAVPSLLGEPIHNNHKDEAGTSPLNHHEATSKEETPIQPLSFITEPMSEEEKRALKAEPLDNIEVQRPDYVYGFMLRALSKKGLPTEIINQIYKKLISRWIIRYAITMKYILVDTEDEEDIDPQRIFDSFIMLNSIDSELTSPQKLEKFDWFIRAGARANAVIPEEGLSYLYYAVLERQHELVEALLLAGASVNDPFWDGWDLLTTAIRKGEDEKAFSLMWLCKELRAISSDDRPDSNKLYEAVKNGANDVNMQIAREYIKESAEANGIHPESLICFAVREDHHPTVEILLRHGANPHAKCADGKSLFTLASQNDEMKRVLQEALGFQS